jgi:hypothetical protein
VTIARQAHRAGRPNSCPLPAPRPYKDSDLDYIWLVPTDDALPSLPSLRE